MPRLLRILRFLPYVSAFLGVIFGIAFNATPEGLKNPIIGFLIVGTGMLISAIIAQIHTWWERTTIVDFIAMRPHLLDYGFWLELKTQFQTEEATLNDHQLLDLWWRHSPENKKIARRLYRAEIQGIMKRFAPDPS